MPVEASGDAAGRTALCVSGWRTLTLEEQIAEAERLLEERRVGEAIMAFDAAEAMGADVDGCSAARWMSFMLAGDFEAAWRESDAIRRRGGEDPHRFWQGEEIRGERVIVRCLHGFGDAVQMLRYVPQLRATAAEVVLEVPPRMVELAPMLEGVGTVVTWGEGASATAHAWEVQVEVMELPYLFRTRVGELPLAVDYLRVDVGEIERVRGRMGESGGRLRVGVVWAAGTWNVTRSMQFNLFITVLQMAGVELWSLQGGEASSDGESMIAAGLLRDGAVCGDGLVALAALIANLDLVITVDTLAAHLTGAMGKPVWVLLQHAADWRWMVEREDSPWYPGMRLFRQDKGGGWESVMRRVRMALEKRVEEGVA